MSKDKGKGSEKDIGSHKQFEERVKQLKMSDDSLIGLYRTMCTVRHFEYMADKLYAAGKVHGTMHLSAGQEAVAAGISLAVQPHDYLINHHRGHGHFIAKGADINLMMAEFLGKDAGYNHGRGGSMHIADFQSNNLGANGIVGGGIPQAVGVGLALQMQKRKEICICIFGDGAANEGVFHEAMNMVGVVEIAGFICLREQQIWHVHRCGTGHGQTSYCSTR
jgi:acetoin:2,6-dichlorophenolindophenol oxidoreductase subunit alpha